jgi:hypothetical protein
VDFHRVMETLVILYYWNLYNNVGKKIIKKNFVDIKTKFLDKNCIVMPKGFG